MASPSDGSAVSHGFTEEEIDQIQPDIPESELRARGPFYDIECTDGSKVRVKLLAIRRYFISLKDKKRKFRSAPEFDESFLRYIVREMKYRRRKGFDNVVIISGDERSGKSNLAKKLALALDKDFDYSHICFTSEELDKAMRNGKDGDTFISDESGVDYLNTEWWTDEQVMLKKKMMVVGMMHYTFIFVLPHKDDLTSSISDRRAEWWIEVFTDDKLKRGYAALRRAVRSPWHRGIFWKTEAYFRFKKLKRSPKEEEYDRRKKMFVDLLNSGLYGTRKSRARQTLDKAIALLYGSINPKTSKRWTQKDIGDKLDLSQSVVSEAIKAGRTASPDGDAPAE